MAWGDHKEPVDPARRDHLPPIPPEQPVHHEPVGEAATPAYDPGAVRQMPPVAPGGSAPATSASPMPPADAPTELIAAPASLAAGSIVDAAQPPAAVEAAPPKISPYAALADEDESEALQPSGAGGPDELGAPELQPIPERNWAPVVLITVGIVAALALGVGLFLWRGSGGSLAGGLVVNPLPVQVATSGPGAISTAPTGSAAATSSTGSKSGKATTSTASAGAKDAPGARARMIAYRKSGAVWVADDAGSDRKRVATLAEGVFALSPDGTRLAVVDPQTQVLSIIDVESGAKTSVGRAMDRLPSWSPDGAWVAYTGMKADTPVVVKVGRSGSDPTTLAVGAAPQASADGKSIYYIQSGRDLGGPIARVPAGGGGQSSVVLAQPVNAFAVSGKGLVFVVGQGSMSSLSRSALDGSAATQVLGAPKDTAAAGYGTLVISPDGSLLLVNRIGDDGYSRMAVVTLENGATTEISSRVDDYPMGWTVDGARIVFSSGNAYQGERTDVVTEKPDGTSRSVIVPGGGL